MSSAYLSRGYFQNVFYIHLCILKRQGRVQFFEALRCFLQWLTIFERYFQISDKQTEISGSRSLKSTGHDFCLDPYLRFLESKYAVTVAWHFMHWKSE